jgi:hypothetical protein
VINEGWIGKDLEGSSHNLISRYYPSICLEGLRKTCQVSWSLCRDLNQGPPEYEAGVLTTWQQCSVHSDYRNGAKLLIFLNCTLFYLCWYSFVQKLEHILDTLVTIIQLVACYQLLRSTLHCTVCHHCFNSLVHCRLTKLQFLSVDKWNFKLHICNHSLATGTDRLKWSVVNPLNKKQDKSNIYYRPISLITGVFKIL